MDHSERLADYLAGELDADERVALEAMLARDAALRAELDALRRADAALAELSTPVPSAGFDARLDARLDRELDAVLGDAAAGAPGASPVRDELAAHRARRQPPRWAVATSGVAAGLVILAGAGLAISNVLTADDADETAGALQTFDADAPTELAEAESAAPLAEGPLLVAGERELDDATVGEILVGGPELTGFPADPEIAGGLRDAFAAAFGVAPADEAPAEEAPDDDAAAADDRADAPPGPEADGAAELRIDGEVAEAGFRDVARCLGVLLADSPHALPVYAELGVRDGEPVVALGLVDEDPTTSTFARQEVWVLARSSCEVRFVAQG